MARRVGPARPPILAPTPGTVMGNITIPLPLLRVNSRGLVSGTSNPANEQTAESVYHDSVADAPRRQVPPPPPDARSGRPPFALRKKGE